MKKNSPRISIVMPTYNGEKFLAAAIESCLQQSYCDFELIIVNDCSIDKSLEIAEKYASQDARVSIISNSSNQQLPASLNTGFASANGDFFTWTSDDNLFHATALETMVHHLETDLAVDIVYSSYFFIDADGKRLDKFGHMPEELIFKCAPGACFLYRRAVHEALCGYDVRKFRMEDMDFWLRAAVAFRFKYIDEPQLYSYRKHGNSLTSSIHSRPDVYAQYRIDHKTSFDHFFRNGLDCALSSADLEQHIEIYFEDIVRNKDWDFEIGGRLVSYLNYLDKLLALQWENVGFDRAIIGELITRKKARLVEIVVNDLVFENNVLRKKNPRLAKNVNKPLSWYYKEYEVLPAWYKRFGHVIKAMQGNRTWQSLIRNESKS